MGHKKKADPRKPEDKTNGEKEDKGLLGKPGDKTNGKKDPAKKNPSKPDDDQTDGDTPEVSDEKNSKQ